MSSPVLPLIATNLRTWLSARGFWLVVAAALLPLVLTGSWVATHRGDATAIDLSWSPGEITEGDNVTFRAFIRNDGATTLSDFNATLAVGTVFGNRLQAQATEEIAVDSLAPGETREITLTWEASAGIVYAVAFADSRDDIGEIDEYNNQDAKPLAVAYRPAPESAGPAAPANLTGDANATDVADLAVSALSVGTEPIRPGGRTFEATITNHGPSRVVEAPVTLRVGRHEFGRFFAEATTTVDVTLEAGASEVVELQWAAHEGPYWLEAFVAAPGTVVDPDGSNNHEARSFAVNVALSGDLTPPEIPEKQTIKEFYLAVLANLHIRLLLPLIALFYAAGVVADEKEKGTLPYLLTRPLPRWTVPLAKFSAGFLVAGLAVLVGLVLTYALLFGTTPQGGDVGFLTTPILASLLTLFVYGALFLAMGVWLERPYLLGIVFVLGWENAAPIFVPWVGNFTLQRHLGNAIQGWPLDQGLTWLPTHMAAFWIMALAGIGFLVASAYLMRRREFQV